jgi:hypothetical protein
MCENLKDKAYEKVGEIEPVKIGIASKKDYETYVVDYEGELKNGIPHGFGIQTFSDGDKYEG